MTRVRVETFTDPLGEGGEALHDWLVSTRTWRQMHGKEGGARGIGDDFAAREVKNAGAWILGRNIFGPAGPPATAKGAGH